MDSAATDRGTGTGQALEVVTGVVRLLRAAAAGPHSPGGGLSLTEFRLLKRLGQGVRLARELAAELDVTAPTVSAAVDALVRRGLVARCAPAGDRRAVPLAATPAGLEALAAARLVQQRALATLSDQLSPRERRALQVVLPALARALEAQRRVETVVNP